MMHYLPRPVFVALAIAALVAIDAPSRSALAHAEPERANPPIDGVVDSAPPMVEVWFTEEVDSEGTTLTVIGPDGATVDLGDSTVDLNDPERAHVTVSLPPDLLPGVYTVQWQSLSAEDQDADEGEFTFTLAGGSPVASPAASPAASSAATPAASPAASLAAASPTATGTPPGSAATADDSNFDTRAFAIAVGAGILAAAFIYLFWRLVRPKVRE